jgi:hypothetical protein
MSRQNGFDLGGLNLVTSAVNHVLLTVEHTDKNLRVDRAQIA